MSAHLKDTKWHKYKTIFKIPSVNEIYDNYSFPCKKINEMLNYYYLKKITLKNN